MKHIPNKPLLLLATTALLLASCTKELPTEAIGEGSYLSLSIDGQQSPSVEASPAASASASAPAAASTARQGASTRALTVSQESAVNNLWILQFQMTAGSATEGKLVKKIYIDTAADLADLTKIKYSPAAGSNMALYLVANVGSSLFSSTTEGTNGTSLANIKATTVAISTTTGNYFPAANSADLPMVGLSATDLKLPISTPVKITLTRTVAKVTLTVKNLLATSYPNLTLTSIQLKNVPKMYSTQVVNSASSFIGTPYYPPASLANFTNYTAVKSNLPDTGTWIYYLGPNARGTSTNTDDRLKSDATAPSGQGDFCTYVEILGTAKTTATSPDAEDVDVRYRLYLGGNNTNDFNLYSNTAYKVGIELTGLFSADARLTITTDKFDIVKGDSDGDHTGDVGYGWVEPIIGALKDGGIVYWVDPNNPDKYKVVSLTTTSRKWWYTSSRYDNIYGAQNDTDSKAAASAIKDHYDANYATTMTFDATFPAAAHCYNYKGKDNSDPIGTWYLPAKTDLQYLWCTFNGKAPISWASGTNTSAPANTTAQGVFNGYLTAEGGDPIANNNYVWSGTQYSSSAYAWAVNFSNGNTTYRDKEYYSSPVRCIKNIAPPPAVGDYYYTDGTYSTSIESGKTANGIVYYVDPTNPSKFKVLALNESGNLSWSATNAYVVEGARSSDDGRGNSAAIKAVYDAKYTSNVFSSVFPAAAHCYNYRGKNNSDPVGTWHLPAKHELQYLYCAYNGASPKTWGSSPDDAPAKNDTERANWNAQMTAVSGTGLGTKSYWSSTEITGDAFAYVWFFKMDNGHTPSDTKFGNTYPVRCVRDI